jgi:putative transposase
MACRLVGLARSVGRYQAKKCDDVLSARIIDLAQARRRFGYRRIHVLLRGKDIK